MKNKDKQTAANTVTICALGGVLGMVAAMVLLAAAAALTVSGRIPESLMRYITVACAGIGSLTGAVVACKKKGGKTIPVGAASAGVMLLIIFLFSAFSDTGMFSGELTLSVLISTLLGGLAGGLFCAAPKKRKRSRV